MLGNNYTFAYDLEFFNLVSSNNNDNESGLSAG